MPFAGLNDPCDVLTKYVKLKLPVNQWFLLTLAARLDSFAVAIIP